MEDNIEATQQGERTSAGIWVAGSSIKSLPALPNVNDLHNTPTDAGGFMVNNFINGWNSNACILPPYWSTARDKAMRNMATDNQSLGGILFTVSTLLNNLTFNVTAKDSLITTHLAMAAIYNDLLAYGLHSELEKFVNDFLVLDNGAFMYIQGDKPSSEPLNKTPTGLQHLDGMQCIRTRNKTYPVVYVAPQGGSYPIHKSRIITISQMPSSDWKLNGIGLSSVSRLINLVTHLDDIMVYSLEQLGSLESSKILFATAVSSKEIEKAVTEARVLSENAGRQRSGKTIFLASRDANGKLQLIDMKQSPQDPRNDVEMTLMLAALALGVQSYVLLESTQSSSTRSSAKESIKLSNNKLLLYFYGKLVRELSLKFIPPTLMITQSGADQDIDGTKSRIKLNNALSAKNSLASGVTNIRTERELMVSNGQLTASQFETLELSDARLPNGLHVSTLFLDQNIQWDRFLNVSNPLAIEQHNVDIMIAQINIGLAKAITALNASTSTHISRSLRQIIAALQWLENYYQGDEGQDIDVVDIDDSDDNIDSNLGPEHDIEENVPPRDSENENAVQAKEEDWLEVALAGNMDIVSDQTWTKASYRRFRKEVRAISRGIWDGSFTAADGRDRLKTTLVNQLESAYSDKLKKDHDITLTGAELEKAVEPLTRRVDKYLQGYTTYIDSQRQGVGKLTDVYTRADLWINMFEEAQELSASNKNIDANTEFIWRTGNTDHCSTCLGRDGSVFTRTELTAFEKNGTAPRGRNLECGGYRCQCSVTKI